MSDKNASQQPLSPAEKRARLAGGLGGAPAGRNAEAGKGAGAEQAAFDAQVARDAADANLVGGPAESPADRRKRLMLGVGLSLVAVVALVVVIMVVASGVQA